MHTSVQQFGVFYAHEALHLFDQKYCKNVILLILLLLNTVTFLNLILILIKVLTKKKKSYWSQIFSGSIFIIYYYLNT